MPFDRHAPKNPYEAEKIVCGLDSDDESTSSTASTATNSPDASMPSSPMEAEPVKTSDSYFPVQTQESTLEGLIRGCAEARRKQQPRKGGIMLPKEVVDQAAKDQAALENVIIKHLFSNPITFKEVQVMVPALNYHPFTLMNKLATNVGLFQSRGEISDSDVEDMYIHLASQNKGGNVVFDRVKNSVERFARQKRENEFYKKFGKDRLYVDPAEIVHVHKKDDVEELWEEDVPKKKPVVRINQDREPGGRIWYDPPTEEQASMFDSIEKDPFWAQTKPLAELPDPRKKRRNDAKKAEKPKPVVRLPPK